MALQRRSAPRKPRACDHRHADRLLRRRRLCRQAGLRPVVGARADRPDQATAGGDAGPGLPHHSHPRGPSPRSQRSARQQALAVAADRRRGRRSRPVRPGAGPWRGRLGNHSRFGAVAGRARYRQAWQGIVLRHRPGTDAAAARHREHRSDRYHHRCLRPHHDAGGQRPRLRMRVGRGLLRRHRQEQSRPRAEDDQDAGRGFWRGCDFGRADRSVVVIIGEAPPPSGAFGVDAVAMTMRFGDFTALDNVELKVRPGSFHALLGENGAGKSTLVKCIMGYYHPTEGSVVVGGREQSIANPKNAHALGLGMVYQHFTLVPAMTVAENLVLARDDVPAVIDWAKEKKELEAFLATMPFKGPLDARVSDISPGARQKCENPTQLYLKRRFLILDEPTSVLTPGEADEVLGMLRAMVVNGELTILMITHKFREVMAFADEVTILRRGKLAGRGKVADLTPDNMARMMIGAEEL